MEGEILFIMIILAMITAIIVLATIVIAIYTLIRMIKDSYALYRQNRRKDQRLHH